MDENDEQNLLHQLLIKEDRWPVFVVHKFSSIKVFTHMVICLYLIEESCFVLRTCVYMLGYKVCCVGLYCYINWDINVNIGK